MRRVYLDQNKWIDLARAAHGRPGGDQFADALAVCRFGIENDLASFPLSSVHYMETLRRNDAESRRRLAAVMWELSRRHSIAPVTPVLRSELEAALHRRYGKPPSPSPVRVFGVGVWFAMDVETEPYALPDGVVLPPGERHRVEAFVNDLLEWVALAGPGPGTAVPGMEENEYYRSFGERYVDGERRLAELVRRAAVKRQELPNLIHASEVIDIMDDLNQVLADAGISVGESVDLSSAEGLTNLLNELPSRAFAIEVRKLLHADGQTKWKPNDLDDFGALAVAVPYCDVVVTERRWWHLIRRACLDQRFGTVVLSDLCDLPQALAAEAG